MIRMNAFDKKQPNALTGFSISHTCLITHPSTAHKCREMPSPGALPSLTGVIAAALTPSEVRGVVVDVRQLHGDCGGPR